MSVMCIMRHFKTFKIQRFFSEMFCWAITFEELLMPKELKINEEAIEAL